MKTLNVGITFDFEQNYLPTMRHSKERRRFMVTNRDIAFRKIDDESEFPVAFVVTDYASIYEGVTGYDDFRGNTPKVDTFRLYDEEIRFYNEKCYRARRYSYGAAISTEFEPIQNAIDEVRNAAKGNRRYMLFNVEADMPFTEKSIVMGDDMQDVIDELQTRADRYIFFDGKIWEECGEPMYVVNTFGLGHNHGGTALSITYHYNSNISSDNYFNAYQRDLAIEWAVKVASGRGDTNDVPRLQNPDKNIRIVMPAADVIKRMSLIDHADGGDGFIDTLNGLTAGASSVMEAGLLAMTYTMAAIA